MTDFEVAIMRELGEIKASSAATQATVKALDERLFNGSGAIPTLQAEINEIKADKRWSDRVKTYAGPLAVGLHILAHKLGIKI